MSAGPHPADPQTLAEWLWDAGTTLAVGIAAVFFGMWWLAPDVLEALILWCTDY